MKLSFNGAVQNALALSAQLLPHLKKATTVAVALDGAIATTLKAGIELVQYVHHTAEQQPTSLPDAFKLVANDLYANPGKIASASYDLAQTFIFNVATAIPSYTARYIGLDIMEQLHVNFFSAIDATTFNIAKAFTVGPAAGAIKPYLRNNTDAVSLNIGALDGFFYTFDSLLMPDHSPSGMLSVVDAIELTELTIKAVANNQTVTDYASDVVTTIVANHVAMHGIYSLYDMTDGFIGNLGTSVVKQSIFYSTLLGIYIEMADAGLETLTAADDHPKND